MKDQNDHDLLIELNVKVGTLLTAFEKYQNGTNHRFEQYDLRLSSQEKRIEQLEAQLQSAQLSALAVQTAANAEWIKNFRLTWKVILAVVSAVSATVSFIAGVILNILKVI